MIKVISKNIFRKIFNRFGYEILEQKKVPFKINDDDVNNIIEDYLVKTRKIFPNSNINTKHINTIYASKYILENNIPGDFVECGVFRGFNVALMILAIKYFGNESDYNRKIYLYDTFIGMTNPTKYDYKKNRLSYQENIERQEKFQKKDLNLRCYYPIDGVKEYLDMFDYKNLVYIKGDVMDTIPNNHHDQGKISFLRLDTDFYLSTKHELEHLYDLVNSGGVIISDDYNTWEGAKKACDEFFDKNKYKPLYIYTPNSDYVWIKF